MVRLTASQASMLSQQQVSQQGSQQFVTSDAEEEDETA